MYKLYNCFGEVLVPNCIELVFIENIIVNSIIIYQLSKFTKYNTRIINQIIGILILSIYTTLSYYIRNSLIDNFIVKLLIVNFSIYIIYIPDKIKLYIKLLVYYFLNLFFLAGITISLTLIFNITLKNIIIKLILYGISGIVLLIFNNFMWKIWKTKIKNESLIYTIKIADILISALVDTGNNVYDYINNKDVIFIEEEYKRKLEKLNLLETNLNINIKTITGKKNQKVYILNNVKIIKNKKEIYEFKELEVIFIEKELNQNGEYKALISYDTYLEKLKGVILC